MLAASRSSTTGQAAKFLVESACIGDNPGSWRRRVKPFRSNGGSASGREGFCSRGRRWVIQLCCFAHGRSRNMSCSVSLISYRFPQAWVFEESKAGPIRASHDPWRKFLLVQNPGKTGVTTDLAAFPANRTSQDWPQRQLVWSVGTGEAMVMPLVKGSCRYISRVPQGWVSGSRWMWRPAAMSRAYH